MQETDAWQDHDRFRELCALAQARSLDLPEQRELSRHLESCPSCRALCREYALLSDQGMTFLSAQEEISEAANQWDERRARQMLQDSIRAPRPRPVMPPQPSAHGKGWMSGPPLVAGKAAVAAAIAACAVVALLLGAYHLGRRAQAVAPQAQAKSTTAPPAIVRDGRVSANLLTVQAAEIDRLGRKLVSEQEELTRLRAAADAAEQRASETGAANGLKDASLRQLTAERDRLADELAEKQKAYDVLQADYSSLRAEHNRSLLETAALNAEVTDLRATNHDQEARLKDDEQYLTSDRDIRELMGARKLYIADVFDVDSVTRTRKPFGRVFYTQNKSLVFYAFDLDHQPGVKNASVFQVWGERDGEPNATSKAMSLGILYMDSESNRRWVLRSDDPRQLAEIDAVFVTLEPDGGSQKPTGKPLLYALLRKEANHP